MKATNSIALAASLAGLAAVAQQKNFVFFGANEDVVKPRHGGQPERDDASAVVDSHNYGRWARRSSGNKQVVFDCNNEPYEMGDGENKLARDLMQACIDGVRAGGATEHWIFVEGTACLYLDEDSSGTGADCVSGTIGSGRMEQAANWLRDNGKVGVLGEYAGGNSDVCKEAVMDSQRFLVENNDVLAGESVHWEGSGDEEGGGGGSPRLGMVTCEITGVDDAGYDAVVVTGCFAW
ncbi:glycoside hydrolase family 5 protein [Zalerion maritima]|uniref:cellulase n=1 Tax=Zalerion maritima TaxID=339359 RepID=A0AAD5RXI8_9PEZI|nr:glycoside hydrolase family 5 protein [Zalerion maritima]